MNQAKSCGVVGTLLSVGVAVVVLWSLITKEKLVEAVRTLVGVHPIILTALPLYIIWNLAAVLGWLEVVRALRPSTKGGVPWMLVCRIAAQSVNTVVPTGGLGGEVLRAAALKRVGVELPVGTLATLLDNIAGAVGGLFFSTVVLAFEMCRLPLTRTSQWLVVPAVACAATLALVWLSPRLVKWSVRRNRSRIGTSNVAPLAILQTSRFAWAFVRAACWRAGERLLMAVEIWLGFWALGKTIKPLDACLVIAALVFASFIFFLIPAQLGAAEGATVAVSAFFGVGPSVALGVALLRRSRQLVTSLAGLLLVPWVARAAGSQRQAVHGHAAKELHYRTRTRSGVTHNAHALSNASRWFWGR